ncbi:MAG: nitroreductase family protein [Candidatus Bathyarchaeota archaeon]|nr:nitroreductase family protein [Candidatus Bathyarchaeota archaeon]
MIIPRADRRSVNMDTTLIQAIKNRQCVYRFDPTPLSEDVIQAILDAGRWAPSWLNRQPWRFHVITESKTKKRIMKEAPSIFHEGILEAPATIAVLVNVMDDPFHYIEAGAVATQNMALAAYALGLGSCWIGVFNLRGARRSTEERIKKVLKISKEYRLIALLPIGKPRMINQERTRKDLKEITSFNQF